MPQIVVTIEARTQMEYYRQSLRDKNPNASKELANILKKAILMLEDNPSIGRVFLNSKILKELIIPFGSSGYILLYSFNKKTNVVHILQIKHQKEQDYILNCHFY